MRALFSANPSTVPFAMLNLRRGMQIEMACRVLMVTILLTAGTSKLMSGGGFASHYSALFQSDLRIMLPASLVAAYLALIPFLELSLAAILVVPRLKPLGVAGWFCFMLSLLMGHYVLQDWSSVNQLLDYFFLGFLFHVLPVWRPSGESPKSPDWTKLYQAEREESTGQA